MMEDILPRGKIKVSSNEAMINSLTDKSTETFWESKDEARAKSKQITVTFDMFCPMFGVAVHIDNQKDAGVSPPLPKLFPTRCGLWPKLFPKLFP